MEESPVPIEVMGAAAAAAAPASSSSCCPSSIISVNEEGSHQNVDSFLKEALQNPRHRLTVLRMELDVQRFLRSPEPLFEFQHFPTSYLRLAAHRVAQHYGLHTMVLDTDGHGGRIVVRKTADGRVPAVCLSDIPLSSPENEKLESVKIVLKPRLQKAASNDMGEHGLNKGPVRSVEERKEEYDKARARIFSVSSCNDLELMSSQVMTDRSSCSSGDENDSSRLNAEELEKSLYKDANRVAIFRDREKDKSDPDYDRSYDRYVRGPFSGQAFGMGPFGMTSVQLPFVQYDTSHSQPRQLQRTQSSMSYGPSNHFPSHFGAGLTQESRDPTYFHWPSPASVYAQSYEHFRQSVFQTPFYQQQPLSFDHGHHL